MSTRALTDIIGHIKAEATYGTGRDQDQPRELLTEALTEIDRRLRVLEPCSVQRDSGPHIWSARKADDSRLLKEDPWDSVAYYVFAYCEVRR